VGPKGKIEKNPILQLTENLAIAKFAIDMAIPQPYFIVINFKIRQLHMYKVYKKTGIWAIFSCFFDPKIFFKNIILCEESIARIPRLENPSLTMIQKISAFIEAKIQHVPISLTHGQERVFKLRECAQSIPRIKLALKGHF
jgi:hypothetical protein